MKKRAAFVLLLCALFAVFAVFSVADGQKTVYLSDSGSNDASGADPSHPLKTIEAAYAAIYKNGGKIVICSTYTIPKSDTFILPKAEGPVTVTSIGDNGVDYSKQGARIIAPKSLKLSSDTLFEGVSIVFPDAAIVCGRGNDLSIGYGVSTSLSSGSRYPTVLGGDDLSNSSTYESSSFRDYTVTVNSGTWNYVKGTNNRSDASHVLGTCGNVRVVINGGTFKATGGSNANDINVISVGGFACQDGDFSLEINGGTFNCSIFGIGRSGGNSTGYYNTNDGDVSIKITGGTFNTREISAVQNVLDTRINGDYTLQITGGTFNTSALKQISAENTNKGAFAYVTQDTLKTKLKGFGGVIYVSSASGSDSNKGISKNTAVKTVEHAFTLLGEYGGTVIITDDCKLSSVTLAKTKENVTITSVYFGDDYKKTGSLEIAGDVRAQSEISLRDINLTGSGSITAAGRLSAGKGIRTNGSISLDSGECEGTSYLSVESGKYSSLYGGSGKTGAQVYVADAEVTKNVYGARKSTTNASVIATNSKIGSIFAAAEGADAAGVIIRSSNVAKIAATEAGEIKGSFTLSADKAPSEVSAANVAGNKYSSISIDGFEQAPKAVFVKDGESSSGYSCFSDAYSALENKGGEIILTSRVDEQDVVAPKHTGKVRISSVYAGFDFRVANDAHLRLYGTLALGGESLIEHIDILAATEASYIVCGFEKTCIGEGINCKLWFDRGIRYYTSIAGGQLFYMSKSFGYSDGERVDLTIQSGTWNNVYGGNLRRSGGSQTNKRIAKEITLNVEGGVYKGSVSASGMNSLGAKATLNITGGVFDCGIYAASESSPIISDRINVSSDITVNIRGGALHGELCYAQIPESINCSGSYTLNIEGGDLERVVKIEGAKYVNEAVKSTINVSPSIDLKAEITGVTQYQNPISQYADPSVYYYKGYYYYTYAASYNGKPAIYMTKAPNLCDIGNSEPRLVWYVSPDSGCPSMTSLWGMQMYMLDGSCWLYATCIAGSAEGRRIHIWKSDSPDGKFEYHGEMQNINDSIHNYNSPRLIEHGGKRYLSFGGIVNKATDSIEGQRHYQSLMIAEIDTPYSFCSDVIVITTPTKNWEIEDKVYIVEGSFQLRAPDGTLYISYCAAQTAGDDYCMGLLEFKGDAEDSLLDPELWYKHPQPILKKNTDASVYSTGALVYVPSPDGSELWGVYHAKLHTSSSYNGRCLFITKITWKDDHKPVVAQPEALDTVFTIKMNPMPLEYRISGFDNFEELVYQKDPDIPADPTPDDSTSTDELPSGGGSGTTYIIIIAIAGSVCVICACVLLLVLTAPKKAKPAPAQADDITEAESDERKE